MSILRHLVVGLLLLATTALVPTHVQAAGELRFEQTAGDVVSSGYNTYLVPVTLEMTNTGTERLTNFQIEDDLDIFRSGNVVEIGPIEVLQGNLDVNPNFNGTNDIELLAGHDTLAVGATATLQFDVTFYAEVHSGPFTNRAIASALKEVSGTTVTRTAKAKFRLPLHPEIEFTKTAGAVSNNADGTFSVPITLDITNVGKEAIERLQLKDDLDIFDSGNLVSVDSIEVVSGDLALRSGYDGLNEVRLLTGRDTLANGASASVRFNVTFDPGSETGPFTNWAIAWTAGAESDIGIDIGARAYINLPQDRAGISINKSAGDVRVAADGSLSVPITLGLRNTGDEPLQDLQLTDNLEIFGDGELVGVENLDSDTLLVNDNFDGSGDRSLLQPGNSLASGASASVTFILRFRTGTDNGPFTNIAAVTATASISGTTVSDSSSTNILGVPTQTNPVIEIIKAAGTVTSNSDGTNTVPISLTITNTGNEPHAQLQVIDSLDIFGTGSLVAVENIVAPELTLNNNYDGLGDTLLLAGTDVLELATQVTITFDVRFNPGDESGPFLNTANVTAISIISGTRVTDTDDVLFPVAPPQPMAAIAIEKSAGVVENNGDDTLSVPIILTITNTGDEPLTALQVVDDLDIFGSGTLVAIENLIAPTLALNTNYDGLTDINLLAASDTLPVGGVASITFVLRYDPADESGPFQNTAIATATSETSATQVSDSDDALIPAHPPGPTPEISLEKTAGDVVDNGDGSLSVDIDLTVTNTGNEPLGSVQIEDDLDIFGAGQLIDVENISSADFALNANYDGETDTLLLRASDVLAVGSSGSVTFSIRFNPADEPGPFANTAIATATSETTGTLVSDSNDALFPVAPPLPMAAIALVKTAGVVTDNGDDTLSVPIDLTITNTGDEPLTALQVVDDLDIFGSGLLVAIESLSAPSLALNPNYDGFSDVSLLDGSDTLPVGGVASITFELRFEPGDETEPRLNIATTTAIGDPSGESVSATDNALFPIAPPQPMAAIALLKTAGTVSDNGDDTFSVPINLTITNTGDEPLTSLQLEDDLDIFASGLLIAIEDLAAPDLTLNVNYDGLTDIELLEGSDALPVGAIASITFVLRFEPGDETEPRLNVATTTAIGDPSGELVSATDEASFLTTPTTPGPTINLLKTAGLVVNNGDDSFSVPMELTVTNTGDERLTAVQIEDDLNIFGTGELLAVEDVIADGLTLNPDYDGITDIDFLQGDDTLDTGTAATITFTLRFDPADEPGPFENTAVASATGYTSGTLVSDTDSATFELISTPPPQAREIVVTKVADRTEVLRGGLVGYDITVTSLSDFTIADVLVIDQPPAGFVFVANSALLIRAGPDGQPGSMDDISRGINTNGTDPVVFEPFDLAPNETVTLRYLLRVSTGVVDGEHVNSVTVDTGNPVPASTTGKVTVVADPIFEKTTLIGKVFNDKNKNLKQDKNEPGIPGVRLATVSGLTMETDAEGRYHLAGIDVARFERGANFIIKVDDATLPADSELLSENPRVIRLTQAIVSRVNFAVSLSEAGRETCLRACFTVTPVFREKTNIQNVYFESGVSKIPDGYAMDIQTALNKYSDKYRPRLRFVGYADSRPVSDSLAAQLGVRSGEDANIVLSERRAHEVCEFTTQYLGVEADCGDIDGEPGDSVEGRGSTGANSISSGPELMAQDRRVEIEIDYFEVEQFSAPETVEQVRCDVTPVRSDLDVLLDNEPRITGPQLSCVNYREPAAALTPDPATAREIRVSGGLFGCNRLVTDVLLPGTEMAGGAYARSAVTAYASDYQDGRANGSVCRENIKVGEYPIEVRTDMGSVIWITSAGDVIRKEDPSNDEHIVVTPFRDDTDLTIITALRIANEGKEPESTPTVTPMSGAPHVYQTVDTLNLDPRLDVLALDHAVADERGFVKTIRFSAYTNYAAFIEYYALDLYGLERGGYSRVPLLTLTSDNIDYDKTFTVHGGSIDVSSYDELEYVLRASDCDALSANVDCHIDKTKPRLLKIHSSEAVVEPACETVFCGASKLWGQTNLAVQRIPVYGARVRTFGPEEPGLLTKRVYGKLVPFGADDQYVLEEHLRPTQLSDDGDPATDARGNPKQIPAHATGIRVSGGLFGCGIEVGQDVPELPQLPGRENKNEPIEMALTIVAEHSQPPIECDNGQMAGAYPIIVETKEGSIVSVTKAGDVMRDKLPESSINRQRIVVTPFRDDTKNSVVSALRITNEGVIADKIKEPDPPEPILPTLDIAEDHSFTVALANLTIGANNLSGNPQLLSGDDHFDGSTFADGRLAVFTKRKVKGKYTLTAQLDTTEDELRNLSDNLKRKDPRRMFRQLDPNRHYGVYGDDSTTTSEVDSQGAMYVRLGWDDNTALWGNYNTGLTGTEFAQYNRSLYGAKFRHRNQVATRNGDSKTELTVFGSEAQSVAAHVTFQATGGSLYYLRDIDIVQGSEKVWIEVRRRDTEQVVEREVMFQGRDYEVDALQGRIILSRPLSQIVAERSNTIIRSSPLEGDEVFLLVDYEYVPDVFNADEITYGARGRAWLGDSIGVGATTVVDGRNGADYELQGLDLVFKKNERTYLRGEFASSDARQNNANFISLDGGLSFQSQAGAAPGIGSDGNAIGFEGRVDLAEISDALKGDLRAWSKRRDAGFSTGRLGQGVGVNDSGFESQLKIGEIEVSASYTDLEREQLSRERVTRVQAEGNIGKIKAGVELRHEDIDIQNTGPTGIGSNLNGAFNDGEGLLVGARLGYELDEKKTVYVAGQTVADDTGTYKENDLFSVGINTAVNDDLAVSLEASDGDRGSALMGGVDFATAGGLNFNLSGGVGSGAISQFGTRYSIAEGHELYGSYTVDADRTESARNLLTLGQRRAFGNSLSLFAESQFGKSDRYANVAHVFGLNFDEIEDWRFSASMQFGENSRQGVDFERKALSLGAFLQQEELKISSRIELREDDGVGVHSRQYVSSNSLTKLIGKDNRIFGQLNLSWTDDELNGGRDARFIEFELGHAYRPAKIDNFNLIAKYSFLYDLPTEGQATVRPDERSHLLALDGLYDFGNSWELGGKLAFRQGERRSMRDSGPWMEFGARLAAVRARYNVNNEWDGLVEYRWLAEFDGDNSRDGALLGLYRKVGDHMKIGLGFNFTDFDDELRLDSYQNHGWFLDLIGQY